MTVAATQWPSPLPDVASMGIVAARFDEAMKFESIALVLQCFEKVSTLKFLELTVSVEHPIERFGTLSYSCSCNLALSYTPSVLMLPQLDRNARPVNVVELFIRREGRTDEQFRIALGDYFKDVWPAFDDRAHLFGGVGAFKVIREDALAILSHRGSAEFNKRLRTLID